MKIFSYIVGRIYIQLFNHKLYSNAKNLGGENEIDSRFSVELFCDGDRNHGGMCDYDYDDNDHYDDDGDDDDNGDGDDDDDDNGDDDDDYSDAHH